MRIDQASSRQVGSKLAGVAIGALVLAALAGCASFRTSGMYAYQMSGTNAYQANGNDQWLTTADADQLVNAMAAKGMIPETIDCRFADTTPGQLAYSTKFTWKRAPANSRYHWEIGDPAYLASKEVKANRVGLRRAYAKLVQDPVTGQKVGCSIWVS